MKFATNLLVRQSAVKDLLTCWVTLGILLLYFGVPWLTSALASVAVLGQATMGLFVLRAILPRFPQSILSLLGPGMILGSAVSVAVFQIVGRGLVGLVVVVVGSVFTVSRYLIAQADPSFNDARFRLSLRLLCVASLSLAWEFPEVLPAAIGLALWDLGSIARTRTPSLRFVRFICPLALIALPIWSFVTRSEYWWLITDDYKFFEVLTRHLVSNGPFDALGQFSPSRYHWLSYGWSGLVNELAGNPDPLVTLARVIPPTYSISLAASLLLVAKILLGRSHIDLQTCAFVLAVVGLNRLDWSGTSTAGVFAVLAGMAATVVISLHVRSSTGRRISVEAIFLSIVLLTKFPSVFVAAAAVLALEVNRLARRLGRDSLRFSAMITLLSMALVFSTVPLAGMLVGGYSVGRFNPGLGQLAWFGPDFAAFGLALKHLPMILVVSLPLAHLCCIRNPASPIKQSVVFGALALTLFAILTEVAVIGNANISDYFSDPIWLVATLALFVLPIPSKRVNENGLSLDITLGIVIFVGLGMVWWMWSPPLWDLLNDWVPVGRKLQIELLRFVTSDPRVGAILVSLMLLLPCFLAARRFRRRLLQATISVPFGLVILTVCFLAPQSVAALRTEVDDATVERNLGSLDSRLVGTWLKRNSQRSDIVATNHLRNMNGDLLDDYALSLWSEREFFILGPRFGLGGEEGLGRVMISEAFARDEPTALKELQTFGVRWFIADTRLTPVRQWSNGTTVRASFKNFLILELSNSD